MDLLSFDFKLHTFHFAALLDVSIKEVNEVSKCVVVAWRCLCISLLLCFFFVKYCGGDVLCCSGVVLW